MTKQEREHKKALEAAGKWNEFLFEQRELIMSGDKPPAAYRTCIEKFLGIDALIPTKKKDLKTVIKETKEEAKEVQAGLANIKPNEDDRLISSMPGVLPPVSRASFEGKVHATEIQNITWVADNMRLVGVKAKDCPSLRAWNLLCECRENADFRIAFWKEQYGKTVPAKSMLDKDPSKDKMDGEVTIGLIEKLTKASDEAKLASKEREGAYGN
jgi:hypothetical protein